MGKSFTKFRLFFHKVSIIINTRFLSSDRNFMPDAYNSLLKRRSSTHTPCFSSSSSAKRRPRSAAFRGPKIIAVRGC